MVILVFHDDKKITINTMYQEYCLFAATKISSRVSISYRYMYWGKIYSQINQDFHCVLRLIRVKKV